MARIGMPVAEDFEDSEFTVPKNGFENAGHEVIVIGRRRGELLEGKQGQAVARTDAAASEIDPQELDALVIVGGYSPDHLRTEPNVVDLVKRFADTGRTLAAICHGPQLLIEAGLVADRTLTSWPSVRTDLENAGAQWLDRAVVEDENFITSRNPDDLDAFTKAVLDRL